MHDHEILRSTHCHDLHRITFSTILQPSKTPINRDGAKLLMLVLNNKRIIDNKRIIMNNKRITEFCLRRISEIFRPRFE